MSPDDISGSAWFFETWSSKDGLAFASHRQVDPNGGVRRAVLATVALAPPHWRPASVSLPLARRAERGPFQPGLFDEKGAIGFKSLANLIEVVRQAYVGGGGGPRARDEEPAPTEPPPEELTSPEARRAWEHLQSRFLRAQRSEFRPLARETVNQMDAIFATAFNFLGPATIDRIKSAQDVADWGCVLVRMGLGSDVGSIPRVHPHAWPWLASVPSVADGLLFRVPTPLGGPWPNRSLGDALAWHLANRKHIETMQVEGLALVIFSASALVAGSHLFTTSEHGRSPASELLVEAIEWFLRQLPTVDPNSRQGAVLK